jgi:hypothetical protein
MVNISTSNQDELSRILDACLDQIANGSETVDTVVERYPKYKEQLKPALEAAQWLQSRSEVFNPRPGFVQLSQRRLVNRFRSNGGQAGTTATDTLSRIPAFFQERRMVFQYSALVTLTAVLLFVGYQSTSFLIQRSIPGDPLYETKLAQEELQVTLTRSEAGQTRLRIKYAQRRVVEMQELVMVGRDRHLAEAMANFEYQLAEAATGIMAVAKTDESGAAVLANVFEETLAVPIRNLVGILDTTPAFASAVFVDSFNTLTAELFEQPIFDTVLVLTTTTPTSTSTPTMTPTMTFTATFSPTSTEEVTATSLATTTAPPIEEVLPTEPAPKTPKPAAPSPTATPKPNNDPPAAPTVQPTSAPTPTNPPTDTQPPPPPDNPTPTPEKTRKPKPTQHPTYWPSATP